MQYVIQNYCSKLSSFEQNLVPKVESELYQLIFSLFDDNQLVCIDQVTIGNNPEKIHSCLKLADIKSNKFFL